MVIHRTIYTLSSNHPPIDRAPTLRRLRKSFVAVFLATVIVNCGNNEAGERTGKRASDDDFVRTELNVLCDNQLEDAFEKGRLTTDQVRSACECFRDSFQTLNVTELRNLIQFEIALKEGSASDIPRDERPTLQATSAMQEANKCLMPDPIK